ncbi:MAG: PAS domain S-box protein [Smithellaceae bacterium]|jgi:PAS domain S-box-containing protein|nr:PAS domain S-box protein [Smithellaceae bacterium]MDD3259748.1 PAS domain S-box protein [Smithellaceae bacterium]MDD3849318.1 PAS domain S-box protein [Smithellaceae bacterium]HOG11700.1 PAS domain S-box protein [Smithellaceae bacterium]HOQ71626.1 PAS domain S-box protein [Smithellaceae bacterium]
MSKPTAKKASPKKTRGSDSKENFFDRTIGNDEKRYRLLAENLTDVIWVLDLQLKHTYVSPSVERLRGYPPEEAVRQSLEEFLTPDSHKKVLDIFSREFSQETQGQRHAREWTQSIEVEMLRKDGSTIWTEVKASLLYDDHGRPEGILGITRDISERKKTEQALKKSEEYYRAIFEHTATANMILAEDTTVLSVNANFEKTMGYSKKEVENKMSWTRFVVDEDLAVMVERHKTRRTNPESVPGTYEFRGPTRSGDIRTFFLSVEMIPGTTNSVASLFDITDRKKAEDDLRQSEERFRDMARLLPETVFEADLNGTVTFVNEPSFDRFGFTRGDVEKGMSLFNVLAPEDRERAGENFQRIIRGESLGLNEYIAQKKDGARFPVMVHTSRIFKEGKPAGFRGFLIDISEKKAMEEQLLRAQKLEAIGTLAGGIAHDFNNLLMGILGNISLMLMNMEQEHPFHERLKNMEEYVQKGSNLTRQLLGFARGGKYEVRTTHLGKFVARSAEVFGRTRKEISIHHQAEKDLWYVDVDRGQMDQVLLNLFVNAWQAMPGGGHLDISVENTALENQDVAGFGVQPGRFVKLTVKDTGIGMDEATRLRIFEPFFSTKKRGRGTGLGLASVYGIIKNHGGFISAESEKGTGSSFIIHLPASEKKADEEDQQESRPAQGRGTILIIDDEEMIVDVGSQMLEGLGYSVLTAGGGRKGVDVFARNAEIIDLVILDMIMPDLSGRETFEALRSRNPAVNVLLSSGYSLDGQAKELIAEGCRGFIQKPFTMAELSRKVREFIEKS